MFRSNFVGRGIAAVALLGLLVSTQGCGGGDARDKVHAPLVRAFSPFLSPMDFTGGLPQQNPTFTDGNLTVSTDPQYPGKIMIIFQEGTTIDPRSLFVGGDPAIGLDLSALQVLQTIPGFGNVELKLKPTLGVPTTTSDGVHVMKDRVVLSPLTLPLPVGQYSIGVFKNLRNTMGDGLRDGPVFHSFNVGQTDTVRPFVVASNPVDGEPGVGAGLPPRPPPGGAQPVDNLRTSIFGPPTPDIVIRFNEPIDSKTVTTSTVRVEIASSTLIPPPQLNSAPGFPMLKSQLDGATLPSNGHEIVWRPDPLGGGFPFGAIIRVTLIGSEGGANASPITDIAGNRMEFNTSFQFQTVTLPDLPDNPFPEYAIWWSAADRVGAIDTLNQVGIAAQFVAAQNGLPDPFPQGRPVNILQPFTDQVANAQHIPGFEPTELSMDTRTSATCHSWVYVMSPNSGQIVVVHTRNSLPVAIINTPTPGGISNQTGGGAAANVLTVTNSSANTLTVINMGAVTVGQTFVNGPIYIHSVKPTGNTPRAIAMSVPVGSPVGSPGTLNREWPFDGANTPIIMYVDFTDGVVNTLRLTDAAPTKQFALGPNARPNDVAMSPCFRPPGAPHYFFAAISQAGLPGEGKVAYYLSGPSCQTGVANSGFPDAMVGELSGFDAPAGLDSVAGIGSALALFAVAESGSNAVTTLGVETGTQNLPQIITRFTAVGANPVALAKRPPWPNAICIDPLGPIWWCSTNPGCWYGGTEQNLAGPLALVFDFSVQEDLYVCARGAGQVTVINFNTGVRPAPPFDRVFIPGVRFVGSTESQ